MAIVQKRIYELETYEQLEVGDIGFIPATSIFLPVDYSGWGESKKITFADLFSSYHVESGRLSNLISYSVSVLFGTSFEGTVLDSIKVYRNVTPIIDKNIRQDVLFYNLSVSLNGFSFTIDSSEDLSGIIIDYNFIEA